ncbi:7-cyano-7-deazaguanine synthase [Actinokineospora auranticolor]|nr:7-cyano-7-deazaguanine synthase [Actinokineospora auranticolor]
MVSGGTDSVVMAHHLATQGHHLHLLAIDYGQHHRKELIFAAATAHRLDTPYDEIDLRALRALHRGTPHTGHIPNRNAVLLSIAFALATSTTARAVAIGTRAQDPDTTPELLRRFRDMQLTADPEPLDLLTPLIELPKTGVIALGTELGIPWEQTWTCLHGDEVHCGTCAACTERRAAFTTLGLTDPIPYREPLPNHP